MKGEMYGKECPQFPSEKRFLVLEIEEEGRIRKVAFEKDQICWEGFRRVNGKLLRGVPKKNSRDCLRDCRHEGCDFL